MKVLWITNIVFPEANTLMGNQLGFKETGGWMLGAARSLISNSEIELTVASLSNETQQLLHLKGEKIKYYVIPKGRGNHLYNRDYEGYWKQINNEYHPDVIHIHGTEYTHGLAYINACGADNVVVSIQGMKSAISNYYFYGLSFKDIVCNFTPHDWMTGGVFRQKKICVKTGQFEIELLSKVKHVIGRTSWDRARTWAINPTAKYYFCNETLREEFYSGRKWLYDNCKKHSIFVSQAAYPIKGLHQLLKALPMVLSHYPDTIVRIAGKDIRGWNGWKDYIHYGGYGKYLSRLINKYKINKSVEFVGKLDAEGMLNEYLNCNLFICPSSIENSPNSLGEAQILGTPCLASYVGGIPDMMKGNESCLYRFEEVEMLAYKICSIFDEKGNVGNELVEIAKERHSRVRNANELFAIYKVIQG